MGREQRVGGGEEGVRELYAVVVKSMSEGKKTMVGGRKMKKERGRRKRTLEFYVPMDQTDAVHPSNGFS